MSARIGQACERFLYFLPCERDYDDLLFSSVGLNLDFSEWVKLGHMDKADRRDDEENNSSRSRSSTHKPTFLTKLATQISHPHTMSSGSASPPHIILTSTFPNPVPPPAKPSISPTVTISSACHTSSKCIVSTQKKGKAFKQRKIPKTLDCVASNISPGEFNLLTSRIAYMYIRSQVRQFY